MNIDRRSVRTWLATGVSSAVLGALIAASAGQAALAQTKDKAAAAADAATEEGTTVEAVTVTGTFLRGTPTTATLPVEAVGIEDMRNQGSPTPVEMIKQMSEVGTTIGESNRNNLFAVGAAAINLRSLGPNRTVVLFNGRRWPETFSFSVGRYININQLPAAAVGRVETLKDGGATTYGADAVGGVVNYITRRGFNGLELTGNYRYVKDADGDFDASLLWGKKLDDFDILASVSYEHKSELQFNDRDWSIVDYLTNPGAWIARTNPGSFALSTSTTGQTGTFSPINPSNFTGNRQMGPSGIMRDPACQALGGFNGWSAASGNVPVCWQPGNYLSNLAEKQNAWHSYVEANWTISPKLKIHGEFVYYGLDIPNIPLDTFTNTVSAWPLDRDPVTGAIRGTAQRVPGSSLRAYYVPSTNPAVGALATSLKNQDGTASLTTAQLAALTGANGRVALPEGIWRPWDIGGSLYQGRTDYQHNSSDQYRYTLEFSGELGKLGPSSWDWSFAGTYNDIAYHYEAPDIPVDRLQAALNGFGGASCNNVRADLPGSTCQYFNPFSSAIKSNLFTGQTNPYFVGSGNFAGYTAGAGLQNSPELVKWLYSSPATMLRTMDYTVFDALLRGDLGYKLWADETISIAIGAQYRELHEIDDLVESHDLITNPCATPGLPISACADQRNGTTVFQRGALVTGFRQDYNRRYPVYAAFSEIRAPITNTLNAQASVRWEKFFSDVGATNNETVVAAGGLRWQALPWLAFRGTAGQSFGQISPPGPAVPVSTTSTTVPTAYGTGNALYTSTNYANPGIRPETGFNYNVGAVIQVGDVTATVDYYDIKLDSIASSLSAGQVMTGITDITTAGVNTLVRCDSKLFSEPQAAFGGQPFVQVGNSAFKCVPGQTTMQTFLQTAQPTFNFFGSQGQENRTFNGPGLHTTGVDINVVWRKADVWAGDLTLTGDVSYILSYDRDPYTIAGEQVSPGFDGIGYSNTGGIRSGERVYAWRGSLTANYRHGIHNFNIVTRIIPGLGSTSDTLFNAGSLPTAAQNANIGTSTGFTDTTYCSTHGNGIILAPPTPSAAGTAEYGVRNVVSGQVLIGLDPCQNAIAQAGTKLPASFSTDATYRISLPQNLTFSVGVQNLFDTDPAFSRDASNYDPGGAQGPLGRTFRVGVVKRFQ